MPWIGAAGGWQERRPEKISTRFLAGKAEARLGLLNWFGQDYHLNPLNYAAELPRARTCTVAFKFSY